MLCSGLRPISFFLSKPINALVVLTALTFLAPSALPQSWTELSPTGTPPAARGKNGAPGVYDQPSDRLMVFGGRNSKGQNLNDVWVLLNANGLGGTPQWVNLIPNGKAGSPPARSGHATVYDPTNNRLIIFGGCSGSCVPVLSDVWVLSNANGLGGTPVWTQLSPGAAPPARTNASGAYDPGRNLLMVFGGQDGTADACSGFTDFWVLANANGLGGPPAWASSSSLGSTPPASNGGAVVYDPVTGVLTSFGGLSLAQGKCQPTNGVWTLNTNPSPFLNTWQITSPVGTAPARRSFASAVYDQVGGRMLVFGGTDSSGDYLDDVWSLNSATGLGTPSWSIINPKNTPPPGRSGQVTTYDSSSRRMTIFGGSNASGVLNDTWVLTAPGIGGLSCRAMAGGTNTANAEGIAELMGDVVLSCTGGAPTPVGEAIPEYTVTLNLNTNITSRLLPDSTTISEALLIVDNAIPENPVPSSAVLYPSAPPQIFCAPAGSTCKEKGTGGAPSPYQTQPNVFAGTQTNGGSVQWKIPVDPPGVNNARIIRLTNLRANVSQLGVPTLLMPIQVQANVSIQGQTTVPVSNGSLALGVSTQSTPLGVVSTAAMRACEPHNAVLLGKSGPAATFDFSVQVQEAFLEEFEYRDYGTTLFGPEFPPALVEQNVPGFRYLTESGFYSPTLFTSDPTLGLADFGTRILVSLGPVGAGAELFVPTTIALTGSYPPGALGGQLQLVTANHNGSSTAGYEPVASTAMIGSTPVAEASVSGSTAYATYEVVYADPTIQESATIPVAVAFNNTPKQPATGSVSATTSLAPVGTNGASSQTAPIPRFINFSSAKKAYSIQACTN